MHPYHRSKVQFLRVEEGSLPWPALARTLLAQLPMNVPGNGPDLSHRLLEALRGNPEFLSQVTFFVIFIDIDSVAVRSSGFGLSSLMR